MKNSQFLSCPALCEFASKALDGGGIVLYGPPSFDIEKQYEIARIFAMSLKCQITGKKLMFGNNVSHAHNRTARRFLPNVQDLNLYSEILGRSVSIRVSSAGLRTLDHKGGLDQFLLTTPVSKIDPDLRDLKAAVEKRNAARQSA